LTLLDHPQVYVLMPLHLGEFRNALHWLRMIGSRNLGLQIQLINQGLLLTQFLYHRDFEWKDLWMEDPILMEVGLHLLKEMKTRWTITLAHIMNKKIGFVLEELQLKDHHCLEVHRPLLSVDQGD
jgi:hypothetical protein